LAFTIAIRGQKNLASLFRRQKDNKYYLTGYSVEDVHSKQAVVVKENSILVGDIYAPQVIVAGMVYGYVVASEVIIEPAGQIWGDIFATSVGAMPGSKVHGWISSMDEGTVDLLRLGQLTVRGVPNTGELATSAERAAELAKLAPQIDHENSLSTERIEIWRKLQSEAAVAVSARVELERSFEAAVLETAEKLRSSVQDSGAGYFTAGDMKGLADDLQSIEPKITSQLIDAETEVEQLRSQLTAVLRRQVSLRNQLIWTKASLFQARGQRNIDYGNDDRSDSEFSGQMRGRHLARLQATIVERDLKLQELQGQIDTREEQLFRLKTLAARRIESLEGELNKIKMRRESER
jgi:cytoskeletal protein CcmA (bactofilin family)